MNSLLFRNEHKFQDDIWGQISLNTVERDVVDTPEYQRLFRTSQLGFVDLVYQTANHTRGAHSIGACHVANLLMNHLEDNTRRFRASDERRYAPIELSTAERILIRLGALLHDISHVPLSHDLERKTHRIYFGRDGNNGSERMIKFRSHYGQYEKHDDYHENPLLYILLLDREQSVLARVLAHYSPDFYDELLRAKDNSRHAHLDLFFKALDSAESVDWDARRTILPTLLFHLLVYEDEKDADSATITVAVNIQHGSIIRREWGIGRSAFHTLLHKAWYQPFRHDIIGNTLSADLIDYLRRDPQRLGTERKIDLHLLNYYILARTNSLPEGGPKPIPGCPERFRCAIDLHDSKRGTSRISLVNDLFRLLDLRHEIHEKAVMHRVVQSANAMLSRALLILPPALKPPVTALVDVGKSHHALQGEETFFGHLLALTSAEGQDPEALKDANRILRKLIDRRVYRPLMIVPGDRAARHFTFSGEPSDNDLRLAEFRLRTLAALVDSRFYSKFLLFVSACVEYYLEGVFSDDSEVCELIRRLASRGPRDNSIVSAMNVIPSRVILWTNPYKQLYKDPAAIISTQTHVCRIDEFIETSRNPNGDDKSLAERIYGSIQDADTKYSAMWKLYVFVSDGLFYTGLINKLTSTESSEGAESRQVNRLTKAQGLIIAALDAVCQNWNGFCESEQDVTARAAFLQSQADGERFVRLIERWVSHYRDNSGSEQSIRRLSTIEVKHYVHGFSLREASGHKCRDIRYKFDSPASRAWDSAHHSGDPVLRDFVRFLQRAGVRDPSVLSNLEFEELEHMYKVIGTNHPSLLLGEDSVDLTALWRTRVGWAFPVPTAGDVRTTPTTDSHALEVPSRRDIEQFLLERAAALNANVRREFTESVGAIADFIEAKPPHLRIEILRDIEVRIRNESRLIWNNMRQNEILAALNRRWSNDNTAVGE